MPKHFATSQPVRSRNRICRFLLAEDGAALVEFAIALPTMVLLFAVIIEGSRLMLSYQSTIAAVRDAARYMSRVVSSDICAGGGSITSYSAQLLAIVQNSSSGQLVFPSYVTVTSVTPSYNCLSGPYRINPVPVISVTAEIEVIYPFADIFTLIGAALPSLTTTVSDQTRVFGS